MGKSIPGDKAALDEVRKREERLQLGMSSVKPSIVGDILDDEYFLTNSSGGTITKAQAIADLTNRVIRLRQFQSTVTSTWLLCEHTCVTVGELDVTGQADEQDVSGKYGFIHVWVLRGARWKLRCVHLNRLQQAKQGPVAMKAPV